MFFYSSFRMLVHKVCLLVVFFSLITANAHTVTSISLDIISVASYREFVIGLGTENEDWEPAFREALAECGKTGKPLSVPAGVFKIRKAIDVPETRLKDGFLNPGRLAIRGMGRMQSIIWQQIKTENVINWSGASYENSFAGGTLSDLAIVGGRICLNIKWHNYFSLDNCYIAEAEQFGVYAEGWSSRFNNCTIRWCRKAGIYGLRHFNDIVIRDSYFSRNKVGISLMSCNGVRIVCSGFENCSDSAIVVFSASSLSIRDCYFESNAYPEVGALGKKGATFPNVVHLDAHANSVVINGCLFRGGKGYWNANQVAVIGGSNHTISENRFFNSNVAVKLLLKSAKWHGKNGSKTHRMRVMRNDFYTTDTMKKYRLDKKLSDVGVFLAEAESGLIKRAKEGESIFDIPTLVIPIKKEIR